jgi:hypothetical protein
MTSVSEGLEIRGLMYAIDESDVPFTIREKLGLNIKPEYLMNWTGIILLGRDEKESNDEHRVYLTVCNIHNGYYAHQTEIVRDEEVIYKTWL